MVAALPFIVDVSPPVVDQSLASLPSYSAAAMGGSAMKHCCPLGDLVYEPKGSIRLALVFSFANQNLGNEVFYPEGLSCHHEGSWSLSLILASIIAFCTKRLGILLKGALNKYMCECPCYMKIRCIRQTHPPATHSCTRCNEQTCKD